ncbi:MAG: hypothetical protein Q4615_14585 [Paracoccus aminovorans]|nr:hypothetical protein [Paracoccus aminovorans]
MQADPAGVDRIPGELLPPELRGKLKVIHEGIDTLKVPQSAGRILPDGRKLQAGTRC